MKLSRDVIARAALGLLDDHGLDGLTMRVVATELDVRAPTLYWHVKNKQDLLDAMADVIFDDAAADIEGPSAGESWQDWAVAMAKRLRAALLRHRDGARVYAGSFSRHPALLRTVELTLRTLQDGGIPLRHAARSFPAVLHYTVGFTIEQQARTGAPYDEANPYAGEGLAAGIDAARYPLTAAVRDVLQDMDDDAFEHGLRLIVAGMAQSVAPAQPAGGAKNSSAMLSGSRKDTPDP